MSLGSWDRPLGQPIGSRRAEPRHRRRSEGTLGDGHQLPNDVALVCEPQLETLASWLHTAYSCTKHLD
jgi:hypothetical protein